MRTAQATNSGRREMRVRRPDRKAKAKSQVRWVVQGNSKAKEHDSGGER